MTSLTPVAIEDRDRDRIQLKIWEEGAEKAYELTVNGERGFPIFMEFNRGASRRAVLACVCRTLWEMAGELSINPEPFISTLDN